MPTALLTLLPSPPTTSSPLLRLITRARALGCTTLHLSGAAAPRRDLLPLAAHAASLGLDLALTSPAAALAPERAAALLQLRLTRAFLSVDPSSPLPASVVTLASSVDLTLDVALPSPSPVDAAALATLLATGARLRLSPPPSPVDHLDATAAALAATIAAVLACSPTANLAHRGLPLCLLPGLEPLHRDLADEDITLVADEGDLDLRAFSPPPGRHPPVCKNCTLAPRCPGLDPADRARHGDRLLRPRGGPRGNSYTFTPAATLPRLPDGGCPIYASPAPYHPARHLLLDAGDRLIVHHTATRDFSDDELADRKRLGQLYLDRSDKPAPDDFAADLTLLTPVPGCLACDKRYGCATTFAPASGDPFAAAEARLRAHLAPLAAAGGRLLDVGCGDGRYADLWQPAAFAGRLDYLGVEPDPARAAALAARWPWATVRPLPVELLPEADRPADALLVLRSWNHLADPARALAPLVAALRPGGRLVVADNLSFGLVRSDEQRRRAESSAAPFEHLRDDDSAAARAALADLPLELLAEESGRRGSGQPVVSRVFP